MNAPTPPAPKSNRRTLGPATPMRLMDERTMDSSGT